MKSGLCCTLVLGLAALSCSTSDNTFTVTSSLPSGEIPRNTSVLTFAFSRGVVPSDSVNVWTETPFVQFTPSVPGKFVWRDTTVLVFSADAPFPGDTRFQGELNTPLLAQRTGTAFSGSSGFTFSTESFRLSTAEFFYDRLGKTRQVGVKANLEFTYATNPQDVASHLHLTVDGKAQAIASVKTVENSKVIAMEIGTVEQLEKEKTIAISFDDQLVSTETNTHIRMEKPFVYTLPGLAELKIYGHEFGTDGTTSWIIVRTSQEVDPATVRQFLTLDPVRDYAVEGDRDHFTLKGKFEPGATFHLVIRKGLESLLGGKTQNAYETDIVIGNVTPSFRFASASGTYMLLGGQKSLAVKTVNLPNLLVRVSQVFQNNLVFFLYGGRYYDYGYYYDEEDGEAAYTPRQKWRYSLGNFGRVLNADTLHVTGPTNQEISSSIDLSRFLNNGYKGFYLVEIANPAEAWRSTGKLVSISDLGLIVKQSANELMVFATSLETNAPVPNALVSVISTNNQTITSGKTDRDGVVRFPGFREASKGFRAKLVTAELENDFNFIHLDDYRVETSRFEVDGKHDAENVYDAMMYGDRNLYRPGEKIILSAVVRDLTHELPAQVPVRLNIYNPQGNVVSETQHVLNEQGSFETSYQTQQTSQTGQYRCELYTGNRLYLTSYAVSVEDFVPDRLRISLTTSTDAARPGDRILYDLQALNFFGPPAANRHWEFEGSFVIVPYLSRAFREFRFSDDAAKNYAANPTVEEGETDGDGKAHIDVTLPKDLTSSGLLRARGRVAVFDESGRPVYQLAQTTVYPKEYYIGIRRQGDYYVSPNTAQKLQLIAVDMNDKPINGFKAKIDLVRWEWHSVLRQHAGTNTLRYVSEKREIPVRSDVVTLADKPTDYSYVVPRSGEYSLRVSKAGESGYNQFTFYSYSWGTTDATSFEVDPEARVEMVFDRKTYAPGDKAKVLFQAPFSGMMLVTVERNQVFSYRYLPVENNSASMELAVDESFLPNVYISAVLFRKIKDLAIPLLAGHGFAPLMVEKPSNRIEVTVTAPAKIRPKTTQKVTVQAGNEKDVFVTLAAVDEGICQVKNYKTPDPYGYFYAKKALETESFDFFRDLLPESVERGKSSVGGGDDEQIAKRTNPLGVQRFKPVALWSGIVRTSGDGRVEIPLTIPAFNGELRLMAFAYKGDRFGAAEKAMKVADPVVITPALPRFLSPNDSIVMPLTAFNTTEKTVDLAFDIDAGGTITSPLKTVSLHLDPNQERYVNVPLKATGVGKAVVTVRTTAFGEKLEAVTELPVRPISPFVADGFTGVVEAGKTVSQPVDDVYLPFKRRAWITLSPFPVANFAKELKHLVGYPHGCIEQTTSKAFPQIYLRDIAVMLDPSILDKGSPGYFVNEAITKISSMQMSNGQFSYWPGWPHAYNWTDVYATHFLLEARKAGYAVSGATIASALRAVAQIARSKATYDYYSYDVNKVTVRRVADKSVLYALYVLALAGFPEKAVMSFYRAERSLLTGDTQYLLAGAYALSGDRTTFLEILPPQFAPEEAQRTTGYLFDSPIRANALILNILLDTDLNNPNIPRYMDYLSRTYRSNRWYSTQDDAFTLLAFGKAARIASASKVAGTISAGNKSYNYAGGNAKIDLDPFGKAVAIAARGEGRVYYSLVAEGVRTDGKVAIEDKNLQVRRELLDRNGNPVNATTIARNDLIVVRLTLVSSVDQLENVAVSDLLPAGFEIENPRLTETTNYAFIKNASTPEYMDIRDDRINLYTSFRNANRRQVFYYMVRAVTQGTFEYAPVVAEAMYNADYYSASGQMKIRVLP